MAVAPWATKALIGVGGVSVVGVGGLVVHQGFLSGKNNSFDDLDIDSLNWTVKTSKEGNNDVVASVIGQGSGLLSKTWTCRIKGSIADGHSNKTLGIEKQVKDGLGIGNDGKTTQKDKLKKFLENCERHRENDKHHESTIDLGSVTKAEGDQDYKFSSTEFPKIHGGAYIDKNFKTKLGIDQGCSVVSGTDAGCDLDDAKLKSIKFVGLSGTTKTTSGTVSGTKLKIEESKDLPKNLKFTFVTSQDISVTENSNTVHLKNGANTEFKINQSGNALENVWTVESLAKKVGLTCVNSGGKKECMLEGNSKINVWKDNDNYVIGATFADSNKKLTFAENEASHNQGFKFTANPEIGLNSSGKSDKSKGTVEKIEGDSVSYYIQPKTVDGITKQVWFLVKKS